MSLEIKSGGLNVEEILSNWYREIKDKNLGAFVPFVGIVRSEDEIEGLSFDIYEPILTKWFDAWKAKAEGELFMAHSVGDVWLHESSFIAAIASRKRRFALEFIDEFVEDFKKSAPIWKYDIVGGKRVYAQDRSQKIDGAGLFK
jgi:molybdopterin synthase catalytic subunit